MAEIATSADRGPDARQREGLPARPLEREGRVRRGRDLDVVPRPGAQGDRHVELPNGGFDTEPLTLTNIASGATGFTIYQDPYLQGFLPTLYLYLYNISGGTIVPPDTDTGLSFITKSNYTEYNLASRYQGSTTALKYLPRPAGAISNPMATTST